MAPGGVCVAEGALAHASRQVCDTVVHDHHTGAYAAGPGAGASPRAKPHLGFQNPTRAGPFALITRRHIISAR